MTYNQPISEATPGAASRLSPRRLLLDFLRVDPFVLRPVGIVILDPDIMPGIHFGRWRGGSSQGDDPLGAALLLDPIAALIARAQHDDIDDGLVFPLRRDAR